MRSTAKDINTLECNLHGTVPVLETEGGYCCSECAEKFGVSRGDDGYVAKEAVESSTEYDEKPNPVFPVKVLVDNANEELVRVLCRQFTAYLEKNLDARSTVVMERNDGSTRPFPRWDSEVKDK